MRVFVRQCPLNLFILLWSELLRTFANYWEREGERDQMTKKFAICCVVRLTRKSLAQRPCEARLRTKNAVAKYLYLLTHWHHHHQHCVAAIGGTSWVVDQTRRSIESYVKRSTENETHEVDLTAAPAHSYFSPFFPLFLSLITMWKRGCTGNGSECVEIQSTRSHTNWYHTHKQAVLVGKWKWKWK